jgi:hypothetical protein
MRKGGTGSTKIATQSSSLATNCHHGNTQQRWPPSHRAKQQRFRAMRHLRTERLLRIAVWCAFLVVISFTSADPDLWGHVRFGLDMLRDGHLQSADTYRSQAIARGSTMNGRRKCSPRQP